MDKQCRLCGSNDAIMYNLFEPGQNYLHYVKKIHKLLPIAVNEFDPLPKTICHRCAFKISEFYEFRINCIRTQEFFKTKLPWFKSEEHQEARTEHMRTDTNPIPMVEVKMNSIEHFSPSERRNFSYSNQDEDLIVINDDDDDDGSCGSNERVDSNENPVCEDVSDERSTFHVEDQDDSNRLVLKIKRNAPIKKSAIWDAKNSNHFGKRKKRKRKSFKISHIFSTPSSVYQNMGQLDVIDPTEYISAQEHGISVAGMKKICKDPLQQNDKKTSESESEEDEKSSVDENRLPSCILVTKIPNIGYAYTCKKCRRTFLAAESAVKHGCDIATPQINKPHHQRDQAEEKKVHPERTQDRSEHDRRTESATLAINNNDLNDVYVCDICNKVFPRQVILQAHKKTHYVTYSSTDSELETFKMKKHHRKLFKLKQKRLQEHGTSIRNEEIQEDSV